ncbi:MAG: histidine kinase [Gemmatimonadetes bacterium]|nr:histidine kinase [Gemmatimonadota bacterium]
MDTFHLGQTGDPSADVDAAWREPFAVAAPDALSRRREVALVLGFWLLVSPMWALSIYASAQFGRHPYSVLVAVGLGLSDAGCWAALSLATLVAARMRPPERSRRGRAVLFHLAVALLLVALRQVLLHSLIWLADGRPEARLYVIRGVLGIPSDLVVYLVLLLAAYGYEYFRRYRERLLASVALEHQLTRTQLRMLKMQLQPHFLFNTLHAISTLVHQDADRAEHMIASLSDLLRASLTHQQTQEVPLSEELATLQPYLDIEKTRLGDRLSVEMAVGPDTLDAVVPHLLLQPLVENAIRHGIAPRRRPGRVEVSAVRSDGRLHLVVSDDGRGITGPLRPGGIGLASTQARLEQLYGEAHGFHVRSAPGEGTRIEITLPYRAAFPTPGAPA